MYINNHSIDTAVKHMEQLMHGFSDMSLEKIRHHLDARGVLNDVAEHYANKLKPFVQTLSSYYPAQYTPPANYNDFDVIDKITADADWYLSVFRAETESGDDAHLAAVAIISGHANGRDLVVFLESVFALDSWMKGVFLKAFLESLQCQSQH